METSGLNNQSVAHNADVNFIEQCVLKAFDMKDLVYIVRTMYYTTRKKISDITKDLQQITQWLTPCETRRWVRWYVGIFRAKVFLMARKNPGVD